MCYNNNKEDTDLLKFLILSGLAVCRLLGCHTLLSCCEAQMTLSTVSGTVTSHAIDFPLAQGIVF